MRMKTRLRLAVIASLVVVLAGGGWLLARNAMARREADLKRATVDLLPNVAQRIQNFHRVKIDKGRKVWEVSAREAQYLEKEELVRVEAPEVAVYLEDGRTVSLRGTGGRVFLKDRELQQVELDGEIAVELGEYSLQTDHARYETEGDQIVAPGTVRIRGEGFEVRGEGLKVDVNAQHLTLARQIEMVLWPRS
jgi:LPS export ABC transporter protein LptC